jgi:hypothetical protein
LTTTVSGFEYPQKMKRICPVCKSESGVRLILWGIPSEEPDESKYYIGGCLIEGEMPKYKCVKCGWVSLKKNRAHLR